MRRVRCRSLPPPPHPTTRAFPSTFSCKHNIRFYTKHEQVLACTVCDPGTYSSESNDHCIACSAGYECSDPTVGQTLCGAGSYSTGGATACMECPAGSHCSSPFTSPQSCSGGTYSTRCGFDFPQCLMSKWGSRMSLSTCLASTENNYVYPISQTL